LERFEWEVEQRLSIGQRYNKLLDDAGVARVQQRPDRTSAFAQYTIFVDNRESVQGRLKDAGVPTAIHYPVPLNEQPVYANLCCADCTPHSSRAAKRVMSLPMSADLSANQQAAVVAALLVAHNGA
jgi:UDP-2-acetamido-2-deoxy-ribo-hexuluronate aminotransferase